jgi:hypothetical protein
MGNRESCPLVVLGYDPGGRGSHGAAVVSRDSDGRLNVKVVTKNSVAEILTWFTDQCLTGPIAAGIDTLLSWPIQDEAGWRAIDSYLRETYPLVAKSVISANGLYGAMCLNGMSLAMKLRERWPHIILNETHPKVLYYALSNRKHRYDDWMVTWLQNEMNLNGQLQVSNDNEWDAAISAWYTLVSIEQESSRDLVDEFQADNAIYPVGKVHFYWPNL